jgi:DNA-binding NtrC family response regulator
VSDVTAVPVVVCVDDEPAILASLARLLRKEPYQVLTTQNPEEAVCWILLKKASLVIADQRMPGMSGLELLEVVRMCSPSTIRVMLSGQTDLTGVMKLARIGAIERLVRKPWDGDELKNALRELLSGKERQVPLESPKPYTH